MYVTGGACVLSSGNATTFVDVNDPLHKKVFF